MFLRGSSSEKNNLCLVLNLHDFISSEKVEYLHCYIFKKGRCNRFDVNNAKLHGFSCVVIVKIV